MVNSRNVSQQHCQSANVLTVSKQLKGDKSIKLITFMDEEQFMGKTHTPKGFLKDNCPSQLFNLTQEYDPSGPLLKYLNPTPYLPTHDSNHLPKP